MNAEDFLSFVRLFDNRYLEGLFARFTVNSPGMQALYSAIIDVLFLEFFLEELLIVRTTLS